jgi:ribonuclease HI
MYFDKTVNMYGNEAGIVIISHYKKQYLVLIKLQFKCTNNTVEYEARILRLEALLELKTKKLDVYGDSMLKICQVKGKWQTKDEKLRPHQEYISKLTKELDEIKFTHMGRDKNWCADALATLVSMAKIDCGNKIQSLSIDVRNLWYHDIKRFIQH